MNEEEKQPIHTEESVIEYPHYPFLGVKEKLRRILIGDLNDSKAVSDATNSLYEDFNTALFINAIDIATDGNNIFEVAAIHDVIAESQELMREIKEWITALSALWTHHIVERIHNKTLANAAREEAMDIGMSRDHLLTSVFVETLKAGEVNFQNLRRTLIQKLKTLTYNHIYDACDATLAPLEAPDHPAHHLVTITQKLLNVEKKLLYPLQTHIARGGITGSNVYYDALLLIPKLVLKRDAPISPEEKQHIRAVYNNSAPLFGHLAFGPIDKTMFIEEVISEERNHVIKSRFLPECFEIKKHGSGPLYEQVRIKQEAMARMRSPEILGQFIEMQIQNQVHMSDYTGLSVSQKQIEQTASQLKKYYQSEYQIKHPIDLGQTESYMCAAAHTDALKRMQTIIGNTWEHYYVPIINDVSPIMQKFA
ncbi:MAG: hypothetical protein UW24_C0022G0011 [Parcubacteria group bacterium GW2011_GWA2_44_12]|nr:MAG: hypothetical protein UW24_C0022G0011 [Parcubacteria group bacterium GW2011_GWA2_44_12]